MSKENLKSENSRKKEEIRQTDSQWSVFSLAMELGYLIAIPLVVFALAGRFVDKKLDTSPWIFLAGICISIVLTTYLVHKKTVSVLDNDSEENTEKSVPEKKSDN